MRHMMYPAGYYYYQSPLTDDKAKPLPDLMTVVGENDVHKLRWLLNESFWRGQPLKPDWSHLHRALTLQETNPALVRLLVTWGTPAIPADEDLRTLYKNVGDRYPECMKLLRRCGMKLPAAIMEKPPGFDKMPKLEIPENLSLMEESTVRVSGDRVNGDRQIDGRLTLLPEEWRIVLKVLQDQGAAEAVIAGGALRDSYAKRPVKDVDIFLATRGREGKNKKFLKKAFEAAGIYVTTQYGGMSYGGEKFPSPASSEFVPAHEDYWSGKKIPDSSLESWTIVAGPKSTEYNIIFVDGPLGERLSNKNTLSLLDAFDIDLCQIATDGISLITTPAYREGVRKKRITMRNEKKTSLDHLQRLMAKYPDYEICAGSKRILEEEEKRKKAYAARRRVPPPTPGWY